MNILLIPDVQAKPDVPLDHCDWAAQYIQDHGPDVVVQIGDLGDYPSLSSYDKGKKSMHSRRVLDDYTAHIEAADRLMQGHGNWWPQWKYLLGNHEVRVDRHIESNHELEGMLPRPIEFMKDMGWDCYEFLDVLELNGVSFSHFFPRTLKGTVTASSSKSGAADADYQIRANMMSCVAGHKQGLSYANRYIGGKAYHSLIAGSFYQHDEGYMGPQGNDYWRGIVMLHGVKDGDFRLELIDMETLRRWYA